MGKPLHICIIPGVNDPKKNGTLWNNMIGALRVVHPDATAGVEKCRYYPGQWKKIRAHADAILQKHDHGEYDLLLLGHSAGGVIATSIAPRFEKTRVRKVVALCSPFTFLGGIFSRMCGPMLEEPSFPIVTIEAMHDWVVWGGTRHPFEARHTKIKSGHLFGLSQTEIVHAIARESAF